MLRAVQPKGDNSAENPKSPDLLNTLPSIKYLLMLLFGQVWQTSMRHGAAWCGFGAVRNSRVFKGDGFALVAY